MRQIAPFWKNERELLRFLLRLDLAHDSIPSDLLPRCAVKPICYLFFRDWYPLFASGYLKKIKQKAPSTKACWFFSDLVASYPKIDIERMKREFDLILSFDPEDAQRYSFVYCPLPYSEVFQAKTWQQQAIFHHLFFIGQAKQRLDQIFAIYERLRNADLRCDFHIVNAPLPLQRFAKEIDYCHFLPYADCLQMALSSRCILELLQETDHHGYTARTAEALVYGRKLVSNNMRLRMAPFYDPKQIHLFSRPEEIDLGFFTDGWQPVCAPAAFSPWKTLELIEKQLDIHF